MKIEKERLKKNPQFDSSSPKTEKAVCYYLKKKGLIENEQFEKQKYVYNILFCKSKRHKVDLILKNNLEDKLCVEIKGEMTYLEVNKLRYLLDESPYSFYILQLTEIDWIKPFDKSRFKRKSLKSKADFEKQIGELIDFVNGNISGRELEARARKRLNRYIRYRRNDLKRWRERNENVE